MRGLVAARCSSECSCLYSPRCFSFLATKPISQVGQSWSCGFLESTRWATSESTCRTDLKQNKQNNHERFPRHQRPQQIFGWSERTQPLDFGRFGGHYHGVEEVIEYIIQQETSSDEGVSFFSELWHRKEQVVRARHKHPPHVRKE